MHAAYIEAESRLKRHRARLVHARIVSRHESSYDIVRRVETGERGGGRGEGVVRVALPVWNSFYRGRPSPPKDRKVDFIKRIYGSIVLRPGRMRERRGTAF